MKNKYAKMGVPFRSTVFKSKAQETACAVLAHELARANALDLGNFGSPQIMQCLVRTPLQNPVLRDMKGGASL